MTHANEQWFRFYIYTPHTPQIEVRDGKPTIVGVNPPTWAPSAEPLHVHHPNAYHPDLRVRIAHHREVLRRGVAVAACGLEHDPRVRFLEPHDPSERCPECVAVTNAAQDQHAAILAERIERAEASKRETEP